MKFWLFPLFTSLWLYALKPKTGWVLSHCQWTGVWLNIPHTAWWDIPGLLPQYYWTWWIPPLLGYNTEGYNWGNLLVSLFLQVLGCSHKWYFCDMVISCRCGSRDGKGGCRGYYRTVGYFCTELWISLFHSIKQGLTQVMVIKVVDISSAYCLLASPLTCTSCFCSASCGSRSLTFCNAWSNQLITSTSRVLTLTSRWFIRLASIPEMRLHLPREEVAVAVAEAETALCGAGETHGSSPPPSCLQSLCTGHWWSQ